MSCAGDWVPQGGLYREQVLLAVSGSGFSWVSMRPAQGFQGVDHSTKGLGFSWVCMRPAQGFQGVDYSTKGDRGSGPVQFEKDPAEADPFGLDQIISEARAPALHPMPRTALTHLLLPLDSAAGPCARW